MMKTLLIITMLLAGFSTFAEAHSGRTDKKGAHNCSQKSKNKGLCTGYHYHKKKSLTEESHTHSDGGKAHTHPSKK